MRNRNVLFLCTGNSCRSQMAEGLLRELGGDRFSAYSAGTDPKPVHPEAVAAMDRRGIDIRAQESNDLKTYLGVLPVTYLIVVCDRAQSSCPRVWPGLAEERRLYWPFEDPAHFEGTQAEIEAKFDQVRDEIEEKLKAWLNELSTTSGPATKEANDE